MPRKSKIIKTGTYWLIGGVLFGVGLYVWIQKKHTFRATPPAVSTSVVNPSPKEEESVSLSSRILFMGDTYWGRGVNLLAQRSSLKESYPFSGLKEFSRDKYDAWIANLECPSVPGVKQSYEVEVERLIFNCPSTYLGEAAKWFTAFSMANNHSANQGPSGLNATRTALEANKIQYFGDYNPNNLDNVCEIITVGTRIKESDGTTKLGSLPIAMCGYHGLSVTPSDESLATMKQYAKHMPVFAYPHMGVEYKATPSSAQTNLYHKMIDNNADAVLGGHPHWVQPAEVYKGKLIVYSLGDFMFDQPAGETQRGAAIDLTLSLAAGATKSQIINDWLSLGANCKAFHDGCLAQIKAKGLEKLPLTFRYDALGVTSNTTPRPASESDTKLILDRLNWQAIGPQINSN